MISLTQRLISAGLLATAALAASAQPAPPATPTPPGGPTAEHRMHQPPRDGKGFERMQERRAKHLTELKAKLKLSPTQEGAWSNFTAATQPPAPPASRPDPKAARAEFEKLTTPQRIERMQARQAERSAMFAKRADATKSFYATLTPEQQKTFDAESMSMMRRGPHGGHGHGGHHAPARG